MLNPEAGPLIPESFQDAQQALRARRLLSLVLVLVLAGSVKGSAPLPPLVAGRWGAGNRPPAGCGAVVILKPLPAHHLEVRLLSPEISIEFEIEHHT